MRHVAKTVPPTAIERASYLRAKVLDGLASKCHELQPSVTSTALCSTLNHEWKIDAYREAAASPAHASLASVGNTCRRLSRKGASKSTGSRY